MAAAQVRHPFDIPWLPNGGSAYSRSALSRILPMPARQFAECADWYVVHLTPLLGPVASLDDVGAFYRVHGANRYELSEPSYDLQHVRSTIRYTAVTRQALERLADEMAVPRPPGPILSVADVANRLLSLRTDRAGHPVPGDTVRSLLREGLRAVRRRTDASVVLKTIFVAWFAAVAVAPGPLVQRLGTALLVPDRRRRANAVLARVSR
jgi:hypothetical protein